MVWFARAVAALALGVVAWACLTSWGAVVHGHPAYAVLLVLTAAVAVWSLVRSTRPAPERSALRTAVRGLVLVGGLVWVAAMWWLRPFTAVEPALASMQSDDVVTVTETMTQVVLEPAAGGDGTGLLFQPGAKVEARAYAAVLRPLAEAGTTVVIVKQPLSIAFLSLGAFDSETAARPDVGTWVVGGHSLGGTVASMEAGDGGADGLLLYASYPASDMSSLQAQVMSVWASNDGLATPADIEASRADLPPSTQFVEIAGAVHAYFGDYGPQPGDGTPTISHDDARREISAASLGLLAALAP